MVISEGWGEREAISTRRRPGLAKNFADLGATLALQTLSLTSKNGAYALCVFAGSPTVKDTDSHDKN